MKSPLAWLATLAAACAMVVVTAMAISIMSPKGGPVAKVAPKSPGDNENDKGPAPIPNGQYSPPTKGTSGETNKVAKEPVETIEEWAEEDDFFPKRRCVITCVDNEPHGECRAYDELNRLVFVQHFQRGVLHGERTTYYPSGNRFSVNEFVDGKAMGTYTTWFDGGRVASQSQFADGVPDGTRTTYFENGNKMVVGQVVKGVFQGKRLHYLPDGRLFGVTMWEDGRQIDQEIRIEPTRSELEVIKQTSQRSSLLKDYWK